MKLAGHLTVLFITGIYLSGLPGCSSKTTGTSQVKETVPVKQAHTGLMWKDTDTSFSKISCPGKILPLSYRLLDVDTAMVNKTLMIHGSEDGKVAKDTVIVEIPMPDGTWEKFKMNQVQVMAPELAAKFPYLKTYAGSSMLYPTDQIRLEVNPEGIRVLVLSTRGSILIDTVCGDDKVHMISFFKKDMPEGSKEDFERK